MFILVGLGIAAYLLMTKNASASESSQNGSGWLSGRQFLRSPADASNAGRAATVAQVGGVVSGLANLFGSKTAAPGMAAAWDNSPAAVKTGLDNWERNLANNKSDRLYQSEKRSENAAATGGDPYGSGIYDAVASNPAPNVPWDAWFSGSGGMGD